MLISNDCEVIISICVGTFTTFTHHKNKLALHLKQLNPWILIRFLLIFISFVFSC